MLRAIAAAILTAIKFTLNEAKICYCILATWTVQGRERHNSLQRTTWQQPSII